MHDALHSLFSTGVAVQAIQRHHSEHIFCWVHNFAVLHRRTVSSAALFAVSFGFMRLEGSVSDCTLGSESLRLELSRFMRRTLWSGFSFFLRLALVYSPNPFSVDRFSGTGVLFVGLETSRRGLALYRKKFVKKGDAFAVVGDLHQGVCSVCGGSFFSSIDHSCNDVSYC